MRILLLVFVFITNASALADESDSSQLARPVFDSKNQIPSHQHWIENNIDRALRITSGGTAALLGTVGDKDIFLTVGHALIKADQVLTGRTDVIGKEIFSPQTTRLKIFNSESAEVIYAADRVPYSNIRDILIAEDFLFGTTERRSNQPRPIRIASPTEGESVLTIGFPVNKDTKKAEEKPFYSVGTILSEDYARENSKTWAHPFDPKYEFLISAEAVNGMSGGPIFNQDNQIVGVATRSGTFSSGVRYIRAYRVDTALEMAKIRLEEAGANGQESLALIKQLTSCETALAKTE